jgi:hypothetical protein
MTERDRYRGNKIFTYKKMGRSDWHRVNTNQFWRQRYGHRSRPRERYRRHRTTIQNTRTDAKDTRGPGYTCRGHRKKYGEKDKGIEDTKTQVGREDTEG